MNHTRQWSTKKDRKDKELEKEIEDSSQEEPEVESEKDQVEISYSPMSQQLFESDEEEIDEHEKNIALENKTVISASDEEVTVISQSSEDEPEIAVLEAKSDSGVKLVSISDQIQSQLPTDIIQLVDIFGDAVDQEIITRQSLMVVARTYQNDQQQCFQALHKYVKLFQKIKK